MQMHMVLGMLGSPSYLHSADGGLSWDSVVVLGSGTQPYIVRNQCTLHVIWAGSGKIHYRNNPLGNPCSPTDISEAVTSLTKAIIFPNPAINKLTIENGELTIEKVELHNTVGEVLLNYKLSTMNYQLSVDVSQLRPGIYFITLTDQAGNKVTKKVVKM
jgi:hypothetical protein